MRPLPGKQPKRQRHKRCKTRKTKGEFLLEKTTIEKEEFYTESDSNLSSKFSEAGFGRQDGAALLFTPLEACYLVKTGKTTVKGETLAKFITSLEKKEKGFSFAFTVYHLIRSSGRMVAPAGESKQYFRVYAPGVGRTENRPSQLLLLCPQENTARPTGVKPSQKNRAGESACPLPSLKSIAQEVAIAHLERLELIIACGSEKDLRFFKVSAYNF
ncbi:MAG: hypothetical protein NT051_00165 [Candidatus Micrarchaeota archaeon]|nr:hypothetical protein [Candidatus Micrarchaeota archaeon]